MLDLRKNEKLDVKSQQKAHGHGKSLLTILDSKN